MKISNVQASAMATEILQKARNKNKSKISEMAKKPSVIRRAEKLHAIALDARRTTKVRDEADSKLDDMYNKLSDLVGDGCYGESGRFPTITECARDLVKYESSGIDTDSLTRKIIIKSADASTSDELMKAVVDSFGV